MTNFGSRNTGLFLKITLLAGALFIGTAAHAQYPTKPIRMVVFTQPGGGPDLAARIVGGKLGELLGQPVVVENRVGANGNIAGEYVARSSPDGYTLLFGVDGIVVINPHVYARMTYDPLKDLVPVATTAFSQLVLLVHPSVPAKNIKEFVEYARAANPPLYYASGGNGSQHHLTMEMLKKRAEVNLIHVPFKSGSPAVTAVVAGDVPVVIAGPSAVSQVKSGRLRAIAVTGRKRSPLFPDVPTVGEYYPGYEMNNWNGIWAPVGTPEPVLAKLRDEIKRVLMLPDTRAKFLAAGGSEPWVTTPAEFNAIIRGEYEKYGKMVKEIGAKID